jgi:NAD(P)-dependent dehydrogenase (short-subunit alcohol dehydrogenase family)
LALVLAGGGWKVAGVDRSRGGLERLGDELGGPEIRYAWQVADVTDAAAMTRVVGELERELGPTDLLIACAGAAGETPALGMDARAIARLIAVNLTGASNTIAAVLPGMLARGRGHVAAVSSLASYGGLPGQMGYCASKAGLNALMESLWLDVKDRGVRVTTLCPGHIRTPQAVGTFHDRFLMPVEEAAAEVLWAIDRSRRFHSFPRSLVRQLRFLRLLPAWLQSRLLARRMSRIKVSPALPGYFTGTVVDPPTTDAAAVRAG